jgi:hypothetical protein
MSSIKRVPLCIFYNALLVGSSPKSIIPARPFGIAGEVFTVTACEDGATIKHDQPSAYEGMAVELGTVLKRKNKALSLLASSLA